MTTDAVVVTVATIKLFCSARINRVSCQTLAYQSNVKPSQTMFNRDVLNE